MVMKRSQKPTGLVDWDSIIFIMVACVATVFVITAPCLLIIWAIKHF